MEKNNEICCNCAHWNKKEFKDQTHRWGECRRYPAVESQGEYLAVWLCSSEKDWCGEFRKIESEQKNETP